jgi:hypothetical protein
MIDAWKHLREHGEGLPHSGMLVERQEQWLLNCLARNRDTVFGLLHGFGQISSAEEYRNRVAMASYEDFAENIMQIERGERDILFEGMPVAYERTGGSTGGSKLIPYSASSLIDFRVAILPWLADVISTFSLEKGSAYWAISPATRGNEYSKGGIPIGLPDGAYLGEDLLPAFVKLSAVPPWVGEISAVDDWRLITLYWLLRRNDLVMFSVWSPTFLLTLLDGLEQQQQELDKLLLSGGTFMGQELPQDREAASRLQSYLQNGDVQQLWPELKLVSCWADASSRPFFETLRRRMPLVNFQGKGLLATEGVVTVPDHEGHAVLAADSGFFEFLDEGGKSHMAHELKEPECYEVVMTTAGGLYRYRTGDRVVCEGYPNGLPRLRFIGRSSLTSDLVGEKLTDEFVADCLVDIHGFSMLIADRDPEPGYVLVVDECADTSNIDLLESIEARLKRNPQYAYARNIGQLRRLTIFRSSDPLSDYTGYKVSQGVRLGDVKIPALQPETEWLSIFKGSKI